MRKTYTYIVLIVIWARLAPAGFQESRVEEFGSVCITLSSACLTQMYISNYKRDFKNAPSSDEMRIQSFLAEENTNKKVVFQTKENVTCPTANDKDVFKFELKVGSYNFSGKLNLVKDQPSIASGIMVSETFEVADQKKEGTIRNYGNARSPQPAVKPDIPTVPPQSIIQPPAGARTNENTTVTFETFYDSIAGYAQLKSYQYRFPHRANIYVDLKDPQKSTPIGEKDKPHLRQDHVFVETVLQSLSARIANLYSCCPNESITACEKKKTTDVQTGVDIRTEETLGNKLKGFKGPNLFVPVPNVK